MQLCYTRTKKHLLQVCENGLKIIFILNFDSGIKSQLQFSFADATIDVVWRRLI